jgi:uncharacterized protein YlxW (UPF0749 family)
MAPGTQGGRKRWTSYAALVALCTGLGLLLVVQLHTQVAVREAVRQQDWAFAVADLVDSNAQLRAEIAVLQAEVTGLQDVEQSGPILQSLVDEVNYLRIANGLVAVSGPGVEIDVSGPISLLDLWDLINELRNAGAEGLALNGRRIVAWSAITTDGQSLIVDGELIDAPYQLRAVGDVPTLEGALLRPGGLVSLLDQEKNETSVAVRRKDRLTLPIYGRPVEFKYARPVE